MEELEADKIPNVPHPRKTKKFMAITMQKIYF